MTLNIAATEADPELQQKLDNLIDSYSDPKAKQNIQEYGEFIWEYLAQVLIVPQKVMDKPFDI